MMLKGIKAIIFDIGGVLVDLDFDRCVASLRALGLANAHELVSCYHPAGIFGALERGEISIREWCDWVRSEAGCDVSDAEICEAYSSILVSIPVERLREIMRLRKLGYKIYALSNMSEVMISGVYRMMEGDGLKASDYFDHLFLSYEMGLMKPSREIYDRVLAHVGVEAGECLFVDDGERNVVAARELGFNVYMPSAREDWRHIFNE